MRNITIIIVIIIITVIRATPAFALEDIGYSKIHPASSLYFLKGVREKLELHFAQTISVKKLRQLEFATRRLRETKALLYMNQDLIPPTLERYIAHLSKLNDKHQQSDEFVQTLQNTLAIHLQALEDIYAQASDLRAKMSIRSAMNRIIQRADVPDSTKEPICAFFAKEASSSSLNQTEQLVLKDRSNKCFQTSKIN